VIIINDSPEHFFAGSRKIPGEALLFKPAYSSRRATVFN
jgi:hypothetical protein